MFQVDNGSIPYRPPGEGGGYPTYGVNLEIFEQGVGANMRKKR